MVCRWLTGVRGASLLEAVLAAGLLATILTGTLPLVVAASGATSTLRVDLVASGLASQRLAQLETLVHLRTAGGLIVDLTSRSHPDGFGTGGSGLTPTGLAPLDAALPAASEWLDERGTWLADGNMAPPPGATHQRRWGVLALAGQDCLRVWVEVRPTARLTAAPARAAAVHCPWGVVP